MVSSWQGSGFRVEGLGFGMYVVPLKTKTSSFCQSYDTSAGS